MRRLLRFLFGLLFVLAIGLSVALLFYAKIASTRLSQLPKAAPPTAFAKPPAQVISAQELALAIVRRTWVLKGFYLNPSNSEVAIVIYSTTGDKEQHNLHVTRSHIEYESWLALSELPIGSIIGFGFNSEGFNKDKLKELGNYALPGFYLKPVILEQPPGIVAAFDLSFESKAAFSLVALFD
ncbi:MAG TPA: hypothetical protein VD998_02640 [Verrucomicrobiae bacterium]|nr:hypothetical protein [Verrucomicrobiae bacterium]